MASIGFFEAFIAFLCFLIFSYFLIKKPFYYFLIKKTLQSYPWNWPLLGMFPGLLVRMNRIYDGVEVLENSNLTFPFKGPWFTGMDILVTVDPSNIRHIMSSNFSNYIKGPKFQEIFDVYGDGIINVDAERWNELKKCYQAMVHRQGFQKFAINTTRNKLKDGLLPLFSHFAEEGTVFDLQDVFQRFMFDTTLVTVTGSDPQSLSIEMPEDEFMKALRDVEVTILYRHLIPRFIWKLQYRMGLGQEKKLIEADATFERLSEKYISAKRNEIRQGLHHDHSDSNGEAEDVLTFFMKLDATKYELLDPIDDRFLRDVILGFIVSGRDTIASSLTWFFWLLSENPKVVAKIHQEINTNLPRFVGSGLERPSHDPAELNKLVYLHGALLESMRLYPPIPFQRKSAIKPDVLPSGHKVDAESTIIIFLYAMGRMKAIWGEDASEFKPERWVSETGGLRHESSYKFFAFNAGPRACLGKHISMIQLKTVVVEILQNYDTEVVKEQKIEPYPGVILRMKNGLSVTLKKRC
ncbi:PREDICTED: alkane hydroxylase MAH1-like isoform X1 [Camelina sativa]|uniref:Alkane hydroxylase MAH1-like isoform X1 n=1 Tax=Camelina sativa TaxID=90675 RepID=A0ABM0U7D4_CAMSA|nr:PREDICTED: alkane hydroxylase MAH1-like isoform X1 [Camelina sativa]